MSDSSEEHGEGNAVFKVKENVGAVLFRRNKDNDNWEKIDEVKSSDNI
jgi:hypothetical protein